jgi:LysM repeat protein
MRANIGRARRAPASGRDGMLVGMTTSDPVPRAGGQGAAAGVRGSHRGTTASTATDAVRAVCPYLVSADGDWRSIHPTRDHRCGATRPPVGLAVSKQRDLCLRPAHEGCATYRAALDLRVEARPPGGGAEGLWPEPGAALLALEPARGGVLAGASSRGGQALLVGLMVLAFLVLVIARTTPPSSTGGTTAPGGAMASVAPSSAAPSSDTPSPSVAASASATPSALPAPTPSPAPIATPEVSSPPTPGASASTPPAGSTTYKVKSGDTLSAIAARFATTVKKLKVANGLTTNTIRPGQVLVIP